LIATAEAHDAKWPHIARHAALRDARWTLVEEPVALAEALRRRPRRIGLSSPIARRFGSAIFS
jgi:adenosyl cobinamide kinase/adenosyl cobinamide phosphate guanylyltransferase